MQVRARVERREPIGRLKAVEGDARIEAELLRQRLHGAVERVLADDVEVDVEAARDDERDGARAAIG